MKNLMSYIIPILILFFIANLAIIIGGLEVWFDWNFIGIGAFFVGLAKFIFLIVITKGLLIITKLDDHPLVLAGLVFSIFIVFSNLYYANYNYALYQKLKIGGAVEVKASELHLKKDLYKTPYIKILNTELGKIKPFKEYKKPDYNAIYVEYCYAEILNTKKTTLIINQCSHEGKTNKIGINEQKEKNEIVVLKLPEKHNKLQFLNTQQFFVAPTSFEIFYKQQEKSFFKFITIVNGIALVFSLIFIVFKKYI